MRTDYTYNGIKYTFRHYTDDAINEHMINVWDGGDGWTSSDVQLLNRLAKLYAHNGGYSDMSLEQFLDKMLKVS